MKIIEEIEVDYFSPNRAFILEELFQLQKPGQQRFKIHKIEH